MKDKCEYYIYVLQSKRDKSIYIGYTNDLKRRVEEHNKGLCPSTKDRAPFKTAHMKDIHQKLMHVQEKDNSSNLRMLIRNY